MPLVRLARRELSSTAKRAYYSVSANGCLVVDATVTPQQHSEVAAHTALFKVLSFSHTKQSPTVRHIACLRLDMSKTTAVAGSLSAC